MSALRSSTELGRTPLVPSAGLCRADASVLVGAVAAPHLLGTINRSVKARRGSGGR